MKPHATLLLLPLTTALISSAAPSPSETPCRAYEQALHLMHSLERDGPSGFANLVSGKTTRVRSGDVWAQVWQGKRTEQHKRNIVSSTFHTITTTLHKTYLLILLLLHTPLHAFLGIDVLSSLSPAVTVPPRTRGTPDAERLLQLLEYATEGNPPCADAWPVRGLVALIPPDGIEPDLPLAYRAFQESVATTPNATAQFMLGFMHASGLRSIEQDQPKALLHYTFAAMQGLPEAEMALGYAYWSGIGVREDCMASLDWYQNAAEKAYEHFLSGPPGGRTLPLQPSKLSDLAGGVYGYGASWASTGMNVNRAGIKAGSSVGGGETFGDVIEYYRFQSDREVQKSTVALGRIYYFGSVYPQSGGLVSGAEAVGAVPQDFLKARAYFLKAARALWPTDPDLGSADGALPAGFDAKVGQRQMSGEAYDALAQSAATAAGMLGRMYLRGEGVPRDFLLAHMWLKRASDIGDREARNLLGIAYRDGLGVERRPATALHMFSSAAGADLADAHIQLGKMYASETDPKKQGQAVQSWSQALALGNNFEAFYHLGRMHAQEARTQGTGSQKKSGTCGVAVAYLKTVAERGSWNYPFMWDAERAWARGERAKALISWWIAGEMGYETAQNNVAFILDQERNLGQKRKSIMSGQTEQLGIAEDAALSALTHWIRSAGQSNVDALVKVGDYYYESIGLKSHENPYEKAIGAYQSAADTQASAMAFWNLGWMYENGLGVPQDWHLAKRFYDLCKQTNAEANLPVTLSLLKLHLRSWWSSFLGGKQEHLAWFAPSSSSSANMPDSSRLDPIDRLEVERDLAQEEDMDVVAWARSRARDELEDTYDDYLETGRSHRRKQDRQDTFGGHQEDEDEDADDDDDFHDTAMIGVLVVGLTAAFWLRARQVRQRQEREEADARARGEPLRAAAEEAALRPGVDFPPIPI